MKPPSVGSKTREALHELGVREGHTGRNIGSERPADEVNRPGIQGLDEGRDVGDVGVGREIRAVVGPIGSPEVAQVERNEPVLCRHQRLDRPPRAEVGEPAVDENHRLTTALIDVLKARAVGLDSLAVTGNALSWKEQHDNESKRRDGAQDR